MPKLYQAVTVRDGTCIPLAMRCSKTVAKTDGLRMLSTLSTRRNWARKEMSEWLRGFEIVVYDG